MIFSGYNEQNQVITNKKSFLNEKSLHFLPKKPKKVEKISISNRSINNTI